MRGAQQLWRRANSEAGLSASRRQEMRRVATNLVALNLMEAMRNSGGETPMGTDSTPSPRAKPALPLISC
jgi:hypothetical protein